VAIYSCWLCTGLALCIASFITHWSQKATQLNSTSCNGCRCEHLFVCISMTLIYIYVSDVSQIDCGPNANKYLFFQYRSRPAVVSNEVDVFLVKVAYSASCCVGKCDDLDKNLKMSLNIIHILMSNRHISEIAFI